MSTITVAQEIQSQRETLEPLFTALREDMTAHFWEGFGEAAARYRGARSEGPAGREFAGICRELARDARGTANSAKYRRGTPVPAECGMPEADTREIPPMPSREPWAMMPVDGSARLNPAERVLYAVTGTLCLAVLVVVGFLASGFAMTPDAPALPSDSRAAVDVWESDQDMITRGAYWSWEASEECARGARSCDAALARINQEAAPYGIHVWEDGSVSPVGF